MRKAESKDDRDWKILSHTSVVSMNSPQILPEELLELQLAQIELLLAMYPDEDSISMDKEAINALATLKEWNSTMSSKLLPSELCMTLKLCVEGPCYFHMEISFPLRYTCYEDQHEAPPAKVRLRQMPWMTNAQYSSITDATVEHNGDLLSQIEMITEALDGHISNMAPRHEQHEGLEKQKYIVRVWFYFPSISTRSKRDDIVKHAPSYALTGFLLAGKPGILCLEGEPSAIDDFMAFIKTESWRDIPAAHKKVSERLRETIDHQKERIFTDMREITDETGERRGERANRSNMTALESWLGRKGLQQRLKQVLM